MRTLVGALQYLANGTRPDIAYSVNRLACVQEDASAAHEEAANRILRYLKYRPDVGITYYFGKNEDENKYLFSYSDASYGQVPGQRNGISGSVIMFNNSPIQWKSKKQNCVSQSTMEAELVAANLTAQTLKAITILLEEIKMAVKGPIIIYEDNKAVIDMASNPITKHVKHIELKYRFVLQQAMKKELRILPVRSEHNIADLLTKRLERPTHTRLSKSFLDIPENESNIIEK
jgi:hypothetical protein